MSLLTFCELRGGTEFNPTAGDSGLPMTSSCSSGPRGARIKQQMRSEWLGTSSKGGERDQENCSSCYGNALCIEKLFFFFSDSRNHQHGLKERKINYRGKAVQAPIIISSMPAASLWRILSNRHPHWNTTGVHSVFRLAGRKETLRIFFFFFLFSGGEKETLQHFKSAKHFAVPTRSESSVSGECQRSHFH